MLGNLRAAAARAAQVCEESMETARLDAAMKATACRRADAAARVYDRTMKELAARLPRSSRAERAPDLTPRQRLAADICAQCCGAELEVHAEQLAVGGAAGADHEIARLMAASVRQSPK